MYGGAGSPQCGGGSINNHHHHQHNHNHHHHHHQHQQQHSIPIRTMAIKRSGSNKRGSWNEKKRAGMSFLIVIAFFAIFGLIIITEILMIDEKSKNAGLSGVRHGSLNRLGESAPDYDDVKEEYTIEEAVFMKNNRYIKDLKQSRNVQIPLSIPIAQVSSDTHFTAGGVIPWGTILPAHIEQTLPTYPGSGSGGNVGINSQTITKPTDGSWKIVNGTRFKFFVFSAFYDRRSGGRLIRVIGATKTRGPENVWCRLWYRSSATVSNGTTTTTTTYRSKSVMARVKIIRENWNLKYSACFVLCPLNAAELDVPYAVSIVSKIRMPPGNVLLLRNTDHDPDFANRTNINVIPNKIGICVKPFHFNYDSALFLLEFLELNSILGVSHFTFYNHTIGPRASCILQNYINEGGTMYNITSPESVGSSATTYSRPTVNILPWDLRMKSQKEIRTEGLFAALNDCLYRNMYRYQYVALIDLDEFIIPKHNDTLTDLLKWLSNRLNSRNTGAYSFQNAFFYLQFSDDAIMYDDDINNVALRAALVTQRKTRRRTKLHPQKQRSKYICKPEAVVEAGNHFVWEFIPGRGSLNVPTDAAILNHYRVCEFGGDDCIKTPSTVDRTAHKHSSTLIDRVENLYNKLKSTCRLLKLPPAPTRAPPTRKKNLKILNQSGASPPAAAAAAAAASSVAQKKQPFLLSRSSSPTQHSSDDKKKQPSPTIGQTKQSEKQKIYEIKVIQ